MLVCFSTLACPDWSWDEILRYGTEYGYDGVEVRLLQRETDLLARPEFAPEVRAQRHSELERHRFRVAGLASSVKFDSPEAAVRDEQVRIGGEYVALARDLDASFIRVFGDVFPPEDIVPREQTMQHIADGLRRLGDIAAEKAVKIVLETHGDFADSRLVAKLMERVKHPAVGVLWDTHHPWRFCNEPIGETLERLRPWIWHTHWKDSVLQPAKEMTDEMRAAEAQASQLMAGHRPADYVLFGEGEFPARECLQALHSIGYDGWYSYEWEKAWHPEIEPPEVALPPFPAALRAAAKTHHATIAWLPGSVGGQSRPPAGRQGFVSLASFHLESGDWSEPKDVVIDCLSIATDGSWNAKIEFKVSKAPHHLLRTGAQFVLLDPSRVAAVGMVRE